MPSNGFKRAEARDGLSKRVFRLVDLPASHYTMLFYRALAVVVALLPLAILAVPAPSEAGEKSK